eukprot:gene690-735_t
MAEFSNLGAHCSVQYCRTKDFLPFKCDACDMVFCKEHFRYEDHDCKKASQKDNQAIICPICKFVLRMKGNEDPNVVFQRHQDSGECALKQKQPSPKKQSKCPVQGCREKLGPTNSYTCPECGQRVCLRHRFPDEHNCVKLNTGYGSKSTSASSIPRKKKPVAPPPKKGVDILRETAQRRQHNNTNVAPAQQPIYVDPPEVEFINLTMDETPPRNQRRNQRQRLSAAPSSNTIGAGRAARAAGATWTCLRCTLVNNWDRQFCEACEGPRPPRAGGTRNFGSGCVLS